MCVYSSNEQVNTEKGQADLLLSSDKRAPVKLEKLEPNTNNNYTPRVGTQRGPYAANMLASRAEHLQRR